MDGEAAPTGAGVPATAPPVEPGRGRQAQRRTGEERATTVSGDPYRLAVDLGTTFTAAAVWRAGTARVVGLGERANVVPSVVHVEADGDLVYGEPAVLAGRADPEGMASQFKRRIGDGAPLWLRGRPYPAEALTSGLLRWVVDRVAEREGGEPDALVVTHPVSWGPFRLGRLDDIVAGAGFDRYARLAEPHAAALHYAAQARVEPGALVAVYDLGGGTFDATVLRKDEARFELVGHPAGLDTLGGIDVDAALFDFVLAAVRPDLARLGYESAEDLDTPELLADLRRARLDCVEAKELLSAHAEAVVPLSVGPLRTSVRVTRSELEALVAPLVEATVESLRTTVEEAGLAPTDLRSVLLVGGSSRIPFIQGAIRDALGVEVSVDAHPKETVALGAAGASGLPTVLVGPGATVPADPAAPAVAATVPLAPAPPPPTGAEPATATPPPVEPAPPAAPARPVDPEPSPSAAPAPPADPAPSPSGARARAVDPAPSGEPRPSTEPLPAGHPAPAAAPPTVPVASAAPPLPVLPVPPTEATSAPPPGATGSGPRADRPDGQDRPAEGGARWRQGLVVVVALAVVGVVAFLVARSLGSEGDAEGGATSSSVASTTSAVTTTVAPPAYAPVVVGFFEEAERQLRGVEAAADSQGPESVAVACSGASAAMATTFGTGSPVPSALAGARAALPTDALRGDLDAAVGAVLDFFDVCAAGEADCSVPPASEMLPAIDQLNRGLEPHTTLRAPRLGVACRD